MTTIRIRYLLHESDRRGHVEEEVLSVYRDLGVVLKEDRHDNYNKTPEDLSNYKLVLPGDVVVNKMKAWQGSIAVSPHRGIVSGDYLVCSVVGSVDLRFLHYALRTRTMIAEYARRAKGIRPSQWRLYWDDLADVPLTLPALAAQRVIAEFLDAETSRIDALIAKKRQLVGLLEERLGHMIRAELEALAAPRLPIKRRWRVIDCKHRTPAYVDSGFPVVSPGDTTAGRLDLRRAHRFVDEADYLDLTETPRCPRRGDVIYSRNASIGIASFVDTDEPFCMGQDVCLITSRDQDQLFLTYALNTLGVDQLEREKIGSTFNRANVAQILEIAVPCPPPKEQKNLARRFDILATRRDMTVRLLQNQIDLLSEHRQALITAAVTGELEVPGAAA